MKNTLHLIASIVILAILTSCSIKQKELVKHETKVESVLIDFSNGNYSSRGGLFLNDNRIINSESPLIGNNPVNKELWESNGPIVDFDTIKYRYRLSDLAFPYILSKKADNDTIVVIKDNITFKFKLITNE